MNKFLKKIMTGMNFICVLVVMMIVLGLEFSPLDQLNLSFVFNCLIFIAVTAFINLMRCFSMDYREDWVKLSQEERAKAEAATKTMIKERNRLLDIYTKILNS